MTILSRFSRAEKLIEESELELIEMIDISQYQEQHMVFWSGYYKPADPINPKPATKRPNSPIER